MQLHTLHRDPLLAPFATRLLFNGPVILSPPSTPPWHHSLLTIHIKSSQIYNSSLAIYRRCVTVLIIFSNFVTLLFCHPRKHSAKNRHQFSITFSNLGSMNLPHTQKHIIRYVQCVIVCSFKICTNL